MLLNFSNEVQKKIGMKLRFASVKLTTNDSLNKYGILYLDVTFLCLNLNVTLLANQWLPCYYLIDADRR